MRRITYIKLKKNKGNSNKLRLVNHIYICVCVCVQVRSHIEVEVCSKNCLFCFLYFIYQADDCHFGPKHVAFKWGVVLKEIGVLLDGVRFVHSFEFFFIYSYLPLMSNSPYTSR
jgi:hypothetical protein